ncbi:nuclear transport factor 2 family protein [Arcicella sp. LKC2W]|uniref:nuclear transport factor 2 family protein n=1 Tax=Arcicella sp. LKC2W TaxID=2984198 RepID=UPI002B2056DB|nr:nuclear transport factor 2 family protein [Arcicella sp. LKC2W]MEA5459985.1 nuclear transport factor 2 family protein [Arcicella sp. LKC2W]
MKNLIVLFALLFVSHLIKAQSEDEKAVKAVVIQLFDGMQKHDSTMIRACFHPSARMLSIGMSRKTNNVELTTENSIDGFVKQIGSLPANVKIEEKVLSYEIRVDAQMATAWTPYELYVNEKRQHCGVDAFQFYKTAKGWKIISIADTRRKCE